MFIKIQDTNLNTRYIVSVEPDFDNEENEPFSIYVECDDTDFTFNYKRELERDVELKKVEDKLYRKIIFNRDDD